ncbi:MAG: DUF1592 domain-containing protein [Polyangiaceae bacterium]|nr:DUF1592 domain-containing protein [Polyangiaceae bacterium]
MPGSRRHAALLFALAPAALSLSCAENKPASQEIANSTGGAANAADGSASGAANTPGTGGSSGDPTGAVQPLRRLTHEEYNNTVRDLLGDTTRPADAFPGETSGGSGYSTPGTFSNIDARSYLDAAESLAASAALRTADLAPCTAGQTGESACFDAFLSKFGRAAFRRPLTDAERAELTGVYATFRAVPETTYADGIQVVLSAMLQSPQFLYHWELGATPAGVPGPGKLIALTDYELASRLSYFLWSSMPDEALLSRAEAHALTRPSELAAEAQRMLLDPRARATVRDFHRQWLDLDSLAHNVKDPVAFPGYTNELRQSMREETMAFVESVFFEGNARFDTLMTAPFSFLNESTAKLYGIAGVTGNALRRVELKSSERAGLLTQASILSTHANAYEGSAILRGKLIREHFINCSPLPPPPNNVPKLPAPVAGVSQREQLAMHSTVEPCRTCHSLMDPIGFGFSNYDAIGGVIPAAGPTPIDTTGFIEGLDGARVSFSGAPELAALLAQSEQVRRCMARQWFRFALRRAEVSEDGPSLDASYQSFAASGFDLTKLLISIAESPAFRLRKVATGEVTQ